MVEVMNKLFVQKRCIIKCPTNELMKMNFIHYCTIVYKFNIHKSFIQLFGYIHSMFYNTTCNIKKLLDIIIKIFL